MPIVDASILAHRGASAHAPENTLRAVELAAEMGVRWIETDVQLTLDGELVMVHDKRLDRTTDGTGFVAQHTLAAIRDLDAGGWFEDRFSGLRVPTLDEFVEVVLESRLNLQLELKEMSGREDELVEAVCDRLEDIWPFGERRLFISGFSERCLRQVADRLPHVPRALALVYVPRDPQARAEEAAAQIIQVQDTFLDREGLETIAQSSVEFAVATVNDPERARFLLGHGCQSILTDHPGLLDNDAVAYA